MKKWKMNKYTISFELYGKKMKTTINANSVIDAKQFIKDKIIFHKVVKDNKVVKDDDSFQKIMDIDDSFQKIMDTFKFS